MPKGLTKEELYYKSFPYQIALWEDEKTDFDTREILLEIFRENFPLKMSRWFEESENPKEVRAYLTGEK